MKHRLRRKPDCRGAWACLLIAGLLAACRPDVIFHSFHSVSPAGWERNDTLRFDVFLPDSAASYSLCVELRHRVSYPYCELPVVLTLTNDSLSTPFQDTVQLAVADDQGRWFGRGWGDLRTVASSFLSLPAGVKDSCRLTLTNLLPDSILSGVNDIGVKIASTSR